MLDALAGKKKPRRTAREKTLLANAPCQRRWRSRTNKLLKQNLLPDRILHQDCTSLHGWSIFCNLLFVACAGRLSKTIALQTGEILLNGHSRKNKTMCYGTAAVGSKLEYCTSQVLSLQLSLSLSLSVSQRFCSAISWLANDVHKGVFAGWMWDWLPGKECCKTTPCVAQFASCYLHHQF
jgi:hypothetical protein